MPLKNIITVPDPLLKSISKPVDKINDEIKILINDMFETMYNAPGVGLAAVQIGIPLRVVVIDISKEDERKPHFFINPNIVWLSDKTSIYEEGCLSPYPRQSPLRHSTATWAPWPVTRSARTRSRQSWEETRQCPD